VDEVAFGRYRLIELIGEGGMGKVYKAHDTMMDRDVAIKVLPPELATEPGYEQRFRREAHTAARLTEPHIIPIHEAGEIDGRLYLVMPVVDGIDVASLLKRDGPMSPELTVKVIEQLAAALNAAHKHGLVHRDVKPSNALMTSEEFVYLIDFGIAHDASATKLTRTGITVGTWAYMAPERFTEGTADGRADVYALAAVLYECLTAHMPFPGDTLPQQMHAHLYQEPPRPSTQRPGIPSGFDDVIARGMAKKPDQRYQTATELAAAARDANTVPIQRPTPSPAPHQPPPEPPASPVPTPAFAYEQRPQPPPSPWAAPAAAQLRPQPATYYAPQFGSPAPQDQRPRSPMPPHPAPPIPARAGGISRRTTIALVAGAVALVVVIAAAVGIPALSKHQPSESAQTVLPFNGLKYPDSVAVDSSGTLYVVDGNNNRVLKLAAGSSTQEVLPFTDLKSPQGVAVDSAGTVYVADSGNRVLKLAAGSSSQTVLPFNGLKFPEGVAVDSTGTVYVADAGNYRVLKLAAGSSTQAVLPFTDLKELNYPKGMAVDSTGTLYVTDRGHNRVMMLAAGSATPTALRFTDLKSPEGVAVDSAGTVYVADGGNNRVLKWAGSSNQTVLPFNGLNAPAGVAVYAGNVYAVDGGNHRVLKLPVQ
jgi:serine/threonine protein kinase, bacterial